VVSSSPDGKAPIEEQLEGLKRLRDEVMSRLD